MLSAASCCLATECSNCWTPARPCLELSPLVANGLYGDEAPGAGLIAGIGSGQWS